MNFDSRSGPFFERSINRAAGIHYSDYLAHEVVKPAGMPTARLLSDADILGFGRDIVSQYRPGTNFAPSN
jgi:hypothetical protein